MIRFQRHQKRLHHLDAATAHPWSRLARFAYRACRWCEKNPHRSLVDTFARLIFSCATGYRKLSRLRPDSSRSRP